MSRIKLLLFGLLLVLVFKTSSSFGQMPIECTTPPAGYTIGGNFNVTKYTCIDQIVSPTAKVKASDISNIATIDGYNFDYKGGALNLTAPNEFSYSQAGTYTVVQAGKDAGGNRILTCRTVEVIKTDIPEIESNTCGPTQASLTIKDTPNNQKAAIFRVDWGDGKLADIPKGTLPIQNFSHTYTNPQAIIQPKIVAVYVRESILQVCVSQAKFFDIGTSAGPRITELRGLNGGTEAKITMTKGNDGLDYRIQQKASTGTTWVDTPISIKKISSQATATGTATGLNGSLDYCFRVMEVNPSCNIPNPSNEVCTIKATANVKTYEVVDLTWNVPASPKVTDLAKYTVRVSDQTANPYPSYDVNTNAYTYDIMQCGNKYKFGIEASYRAGAAPNDVQIMIYSPTIDVIPNSTSKLPPKTIGTVTVVNANAMRVNIYEPKGTLEEKYIFYKAEGGSGDFKQIKNSNDNFFEDLAVEPAKTQYCYKVKYEDKCKNESELSPAFCSVFLTSQQSNTLNWTPFVIPDPNNSPSNGQQIEYFVELVDENGLTLNSVTRTSQTYADVKTAIDVVLSDPAAKGRVTFRVNAIQRAAVLINGVSTIVPFTVSSNIYTFITPAQIYVPTAFTPNGDGQNEIFKAEGRFISEFSMLIFDRWGKPLFESKDITDGWNGTEVDGATFAPPGSYAYKIYGLDTAGQKFEKIGSVLLLK